MCVAELERVDAVCRHVLGTVAVYVRLYPWLYRVEYARDGVLGHAMYRRHVTRSLVHSAHDLCMLAGDRLCVLDLNHRRDLSGTRLTWMVFFRKSAAVTRATDRPKSTRCDLPHAPPGSQTFADFGFATVETVRIPLASLQVAFSLGSFPLRHYFHYSGICTV